MFTPQVPIQYPLPTFQHQQYNNFRNLEYFPVLIPIEKKLKRPKWNLIKINLIRWGGRRTHLDNRQSAQWPTLSSIKTYYSWLVSISHLTKHLRYTQLQSISQPPFLGSTNTWLFSHGYCPSIILTCKSTLRTRTRGFIRATYMLWEESTR